MIGCSFSLPSYRRRRALYEPGKCMSPGEVYEEAQTPALCDYTARLHGVAVLYGRAVGLRYCCAVSCRERYPQGLSTVWRTYTHVIRLSRVEDHRGCNLRLCRKILVITGFHSR